MKRLLLLLPLLVLSWCSEPIYDNSLYTICYIDIPWQKWDAMTDCNNTGAYIGKVCTNFGGCISSGINDDKRD